ncbi:DUF4250 family protein [Clostridium tepidiprofundi]|nr:DUF4250 family protein [Clostridium tepidiprofundi]
MKRSEFDKLNQLEQIDFVNKQLKQGTSLTQICKDIDIARSTLRKRFEKTGYTFNKEHNKYELAEQHNKGVICNSDAISNSNNTNNTYNANITSNSSIMYNTDISITNEMLKEISEMLVWYREQKQKEDAELLEITIPKELKGKLVTRSFKMYENVLKMYDDFCFDNPRIKKQDIINMALVEYIRKNRK